MNKKTVFDDVYKFNGIDGLSCDTDGNFTLNGKRCRKAYNNGTIQIRCGNFSKGSKTLRKLAYIVKQELTKLPF